jgi:hypothetical protein
MRYGLTVIHRDGVRLPVYTGVCVVSVVGAVLTSIALLLYRPGQNGQTWCSGCVLLRLC